MDIKKAVILNSNSSCEKQNWGILEVILKEKFDLFCVLGKDCRLWEDVMDETIVGDRIKQTEDIVTTSHPGESIEEVKQFAADFFPKNSVHIKVVNV